MDSAEYVGALYAEPAVGVDPFLVIFYRFVSIQLWAMLLMVHLAEAGTDENNAYETSNAVDNLPGGGVAAE